MRMRLLHQLKLWLIKETSPQGFSYGDYEITRNEKGENIRRITNASFAPMAIINRTVTVANSKEFGYTFTASDNNTYYVEHKPYADAFPNMVYSQALQTAVDQFFAAKYTETKKINFNLRTGSPWATTAIYLQVNGEADISTNYISDETISAGTISSAQYRNGEFAFISMKNYTTGEFDEQSLIQSLNAVTANGSVPQGFSFGKYEIIQTANKEYVRRITNASFAPSAVINRTITQADNEKFTYTFAVGRPSILCRAQAL